MSRCFATVIIGHSDHHRPNDAVREVVARTLRQYSASLSRVEVITYDQLVESAERALDFETDANSAEPRSQRPIPRPDALAKQPTRPVDQWSTKSQTQSYGDNDPPF